jgi:hypothetical protein
MKRQRKPVSLCDASAVVAFHRVRGVASPLTVAGMVVRWTVLVAVLLAAVGVDRLHIHGHEHVMAALIAVPAGAAATWVRNGHQARSVTRGRRSRQPVWQPSAQPKRHN